MLKELHTQEEGALTFEWILIITLLVIGVIAGLATVRDALNLELSDLCEGILSINQEYVIHGIQTRVNWTQVYSDPETDQSIIIGMDPGPHFVHPSEFNDTDSGSGAPHVEIVAKAAHGTSGSDAPLDQPGH